MRWRYLATQKETADVNMATVELVDVKASSSDSSDSNDEEYDKLRAATVDASMIQPVYTRVKSASKTESSPGDRHKSRLFNNKPSLRVPEKTGGDEVELGTTPEFRQFVAKKLYQMIDSELELCGPSRELDKGAESGLQEHDDAFRLFTTSTPGVYTTTTNSVEKVRKLVETSSDSESENERLKAAAVSTEFVLSSSSIHCSAGPIGQEVKGHEVKSPKSQTNMSDNLVKHKENKKRKKTKKLKKNDKTCPSDVTDSISQDLFTTCYLNDNTESETKQCLKRKKKKRKSVDS